MTHLNSTVLIRENYQFQCTQFVYFDFIYGLYEKKTPKSIFLAFNTYVL